MADLTDQISSLSDRFCEAWKSNDGAACASFFAEDGSLINPFGDRADGRRAVAALYEQFFGTMLRGTSTSFAIATVRAVGNDHAFLDGEQTVRAADGSTMLVVHLAALLRREPDGWRFLDARPFVVATRPS